MAATHQSSLMLTRIVWLAMGVLIGGIGGVIIGKQQSALAGNEVARQQQEVINEKQSQIIIDYTTVRDKYEFLYKYTD